jgi:hypothetical protein
MSHDRPVEPKARLNVFLVGKSDRAEFAAARDELFRLARVTLAWDIAEAIGLLRGNGRHPDVIVLAQAIPGEFSPEGVETLRRAAPLARLVGLLGTWCEGEMRTGDPWPGVIRLYWYQWHPRAAIHLRALAAGKSTSWALPPTATHEDRLLEDSPTIARPVSAAEDDSRRPPLGTVAVFSPRVEMTEWICEAFGAPEWNVLPVDFRRVQEFIAVKRDACLALAGHVDLLIYDATEFDAAEAARFTRVLDLVGAKESLLLCDFPRLADRRRARDAGAACLLAKPVDLLDLTYVARQLAPGARSPRQRAVV